jgi:hypothetical protein
MSDARRESIIEHRPRFSFTMSLSLKPTVKVACTLFLLAMVALPAAAFGPMPSASRAATRIPAFNGGKMVHIFSFDETYLYLPSFESELAKEALEKGKLFYKIDGSNGLVQKGNDGLEAFQRLDTRGRPPPETCVPLPAGSNPDSYQGHSYYYEPIRIDVKGKKARKRNELMLKAVQDHADHILKFGDCVTIEWVGLKFNKTPGVPHDVAIAIHSEQVCEEPLERNFEAVKSFLLESDPPIEGLIVEYEGLYWKVVASGFANNCRFSTNSQSARPPIFFC